MFLANLKTNDQLIHANPGLFNPLRAEIFPEHMNLLTLSILHNTSTLKYLSIV